MSVRAYLLRPLDPRLLCGVGLGAIGSGICLVLMPVSNGPGTLVLAGVLTYVISIISARRTPDEVQA